MRAPRAHAVKIFSENKSNHIMILYSKKMLVTFSPIDVTTETGSVRHTFLDLYARVHGAQIE